MYFLFVLLSRPPPADLLDISEVEQNIAASENPNDQFRAVCDVVRLPGVDPLDALRLLMIYALRYERSRPDRVAELKRFVSDTLDVRDSIALVDTLLGYGGSSVRGGGGAGDLVFGGGSVFSKLTSTVKRGLNGVSNVFTQHEPVVVNLLDQLARGRLSKQAFPYVGPEPPVSKFSTVVVFYVGGATFEESAKISAINSGALPLGGAGGSGAGAAAGAGSASPGTQQQPFKVVLGGTAILNSKQFLAELKRIHDGGVAIDVAGGGGAGDRGAGMGM